MFATAVFWGDYSGAEAMLSRDVFIYEVMYAFDFFRMTESSKEVCCAVVDCVYVVLIFLVFHNKNWAGLVGAQFNGEVRYFGSNNLN